MLYLPKTLSPTVRGSFQKYLQSTDIAEVLPGLAQGCRVLFEAQQCFLVFDAASLSRPVVCFSGLNEEYGPAFDADFWKSWCDAGVHERLTKDLVQRLSPISYSAFSWPYARIQVEMNAVSGQRYAVPRDYSILLPISSDMIVRPQQDAAFFGYLAVFFSSFPQISDDIVQLIISLPELLSAVAASYLRGD